MRTSSSTRRKKRKEKKDSADAVDCLFFVAVRFCHIGTSNKTEKPGTSFSHLLFFNNPSVFDISLDEC
jgi:hypothetical protein